MESQTIDINGCAIDIRLMDASYIMCEDERRKNVSVAVGCRQLSPCWPNPLYSVYYRKLLSAYGIGPVLAWENKTIVGFLPIGVPACGLPQVPLCIHYSGGLAYGAERHMDLAMVESASLLPFPKLKRKEIRIGCMSVHQRFRGRNLSVLMIHYMVNWARQNGWTKVTARAMMDGEPLSFYPTLSFWLGIGFEPVGQVRRFGPSRDPIDLSNAMDLELDLTKSLGQQSMAV